MTEKNKISQEDEEVVFQVEDVDNDLSEEILKVLGIESPAIQDTSLEYLRRITNRKIYLFGDVTTDSILNVIYQIHILEQIDPNKDIELIINSCGGDVIDCLALIDVMNISSCDFHISVLGLAASAACLIASNGTKGKRNAGPNSEFMFHEITGTIPAMKTSEVTYYKQEAVRVQKKFNAIFAKNTGRTVKEIEKVFYRGDKDVYMTANESRKFGIVDHVYSNRRARREKK